MPRLDVHLYETHIGDLVGESWRDFDFVATGAALDRFGVGSTVLSESVPLVPRQPRGKAARRRVFFDELLPEGAARQRLADRARVTTTDTLGLLAAYGRDVAGAVQIIDQTSAGSTDAPRTRPLSTSGVIDLLDDVAAFPLGNAPTSGKASLAGVQEKVLLARVDEGWAQCLYGYPSTHILKPVSRPHPDMIFNEEYASRLARALGLAPYATWIETFEATDALVIERYDRAHSMPGRRIHQEDFNQALGASGAQKYQEHGGRASLGRVASVVAAVQGREGLEQLLALLTLAIAIGNLDMHAKNISLIHPPDGSARLAPAYDMVPLIHYPGIDGRMAMAINDVYEHSRIRRQDIVAESVRWGMSDVRAEEVVEETLTIIRTAIVHEEPHARAAPGLRDMIESTVVRLRSSD
jgi:serine/threonine-protein kinase HipA